MYIRKCKIRKCISLQNVLQDLLQYEIYYPSPLDKTSQRNSQHCTTKCTACCTIKSIENLNFLCVLVLLNRGKIKFTSSIMYSSYQQRHSTNQVNTNRFIKCATQLLCTFCCNFCCTFRCTFCGTICCTKSLYILPKILLYFSMKFCLKVQYHVLYTKIHRFYVK